MTILKKIIEAVEQWSQHVAEAEATQPEESRRLASREEAALQLGQRVAQIALQALVTESGKGYQGSQLKCTCDEGELRYQRDAERRVRSLAGEIRYTRAYYYCRACGAGHCPKDEQLGQSSREISPGVERSLALLSAHLSFATAAQILSEVGRVVWVVEMDGVMAGLQDGTWQEVKCGIVYELSQRVEVSQGRWELLKRQRCAVRGTASQFREQLWALLCRSGVRVGDRIVVVGDGSEWIDQTVAELFVGATRIMDFYHTAQRVWAVAAVRYGEGHRQASSWAHEKLAALKAGEVAEVVRAIKQLKIEAAESQQVRREALRYLENHQAGMAYDEYQADGLPIGSGAIEGSCKYLVTARCKQAGMRWSEAGLDAIIALRCWVLNERLDELLPKPKVKIEWACAA
ncbi:MAG: UPF0236 family protein [Acidobacteria bacterium]|nr:UPF0236 family protein [Acidobacteriota bacterium]